MTVVAGNGPGGTDALGCSTPGQSAPKAGFAGDGGPATSALLSCPQGVALDAAKNLYISDGTNYRIRVVNTQGTTQTLLGVSICAGCIQTVLGTGTNFCDPISTGITSRIGLPIGSGDLDSSGNLYIPIYGCNSVWKLNTAGVPSVLANTSFAAGYSGDGGLATSATMRGPFTLKRSSSGDIYVTDTSNSVVRLIDHVTGNISTVAGNFLLYPFYSPTFWDSGGYCCDNGAANIAGLMYPIGL